MLQSPFRQNYQQFISQQEEYRSENRTWFDKLVAAYISLDMAGYQEDEVKVKKGKKKTFKNTVNDAFHAVFASQCDFYVLNDKRGEFKTKAIYNNFKINTKIFKPYEFLTHIKTKDQ